MELKNLLKGFSVTVPLTDVEPDLYKLLTGEPSDPVEQIEALIAGAVKAVPGLDNPANILAAIYQDDDAHDTCTLTACLNPLHPGPCKGWKHSLYQTSPAAWHALEAARVEKANQRRLKRIEELKAKGLPIPKKLLTPIVAKPQPHVGQTAKAATGEAHAAGKAVTEAAGVHANAPGKVTLGQAVKTVPAAPVAKGPKGKKPTLASHGIAFVIAQEKVTPQYKLDKAATITPEQWKALPLEDQKTILAELGKIKKEGFGPQQKKADDLMNKLVTTSVAESLAKQQAPKGAEGPAGPSSLDQGKAIKAVTEAIHGEQTMSAEAAAAAVDKMKASGKPVEEHPNFPLLVNALANAAQKKAYADKMPDVPGIGVFHKEISDHIAQGKSGLPPVVKKVAEHHATAHTGNVKEDLTKAINKATEEKLKEKGVPLTGPSKPDLTKPPTPGDMVEAVTPDGKTVVGQMVTEDSIKSPSGGIWDIKPGTAVHADPGDKPGVKKEAPAKLGEAVKPPKLEEPAGKPKELPKHVQNAVAMAKGHAPGASWAKHQLAAYQPLSAEEFHALPQEHQDKIISDLKKGIAKFLDPKKVVATKLLLAKFGHGEKTPEAPKVEAPKPPEKVGFTEHLHDHSVTQAQAKEVVAKTPTAYHFLAAKQTAGLLAHESPDSANHAQVAEEAASKVVQQVTAGVDPKVLNHPDVKTALLDAKDAVYAQHYAQSVAAAKSKAYDKINTKLALDKGELSPIEKASLQHYQQYILNHPVDTTPGHLGDLQVEANKAETALLGKIKTVQKTLSAPKAEDMTPLQLTDRAKELLGEDATKPKVTLSLAEIKHIGEVAKQQANAEGAKYPDTIYATPSVVAKHDDLASAVEQLLLSKAMKEKLDEHLINHHQWAEQVGTSIHGNPLSAADQKVIAKHADWLKANHEYIDTSIAIQEKKVADAKAQYHAAASKAQEHVKVEPLNKLTDYDKATIESSYADAWEKHASKAVLYGVNTWSAKQAMKEHSAYPQLTTELGQLRTLAGKLALARAEEHTASLNVPTNLDTGAMEAGPEYDAWKKAAAEANLLHSDFTKLHSHAQGLLDVIRTNAGLKKRTLPKVDAPAVKAAAAESGYFKSGGYKGPNYGSPSKAKQYMLAKVGPKLAVAHQSAMEKKAAKLGEVAGKAATPSKIENVEPVKLAQPGTTLGKLGAPEIPAALKKQITSDFKAMPKGKYLADPAEEIFDNLVNLAAAHGKDIDGGLSVDQVLKTIDETHAKNLGVANTGMLHKKITDWLGTAAGKTYAEQHSAPNPKIVKQLTGEISLPEGVTLAPGEKVQKLAGPGPHDPSLSSSAFHPISAADMTAAQNAAMKAQGVKWTDEQKQALKHYTGSGYVTYNGYLRGKSPGNQQTKQAVVNIQAAMVPTQKHYLFKRGSGWDALPPGFQSAEGAKKLIGKTFQDDGFVSTTVGGETGQFGGPLQLIIEAPAGTPGAWVRPISGFKSENEFLLAAGTKFKVLSVEGSGYQTKVRVRVVGDK